MKHRLKSGKLVDTEIIKTLDRGRKFKEERYITADSVFSKVEANKYRFKEKCTAILKRRKNVTVDIDKISGEVLRGDCSYVAGQSGYCNHVMQGPRKEFFFRGLKIQPKSSVI